MSVGNADKGLMPAEEVKRRVQPFIDENLPLVLTQVSPAHCCQHRCLLLSIYVPIVAYVNSVTMPVDARKVALHYQRRCPSLDRCPTWLLLCITAATILSVGLKSSTMPISGSCAAGNRFTIMCQSSSTYTYVSVCHNLYAKSCYN